MQSLSVHSNQYKTFFLRFLLLYKNEKISRLSTNERKAKFNTNDLIFRKKIHLPSGTLLSAERSFTEYNSAESLESLTNKYKLFWN